MEKECRGFFNSHVELREENTEKPKITGYAALFNTPYTIPGRMGFYKEKIEEGAFSESIANNDIRALWNHDNGYVFGRNKAGTLKLEEDEHGLHVEIDPPDTQWARDFMESLRRGDVSQMSFGFFVREEEYDESDPMNVVRTLKDIDLIEVSPVTFAANPDTNVAVRELDMAIARSSKQDIDEHDEQIIRNAINHLQSLLPEEEKEESESEIDELKRKIEWLKGEIKHMKKESD